jgi:aromatic-L-amino-acid decarboxylase
VGEGQQVGRRDEGAVDDDRRNGMTAAEFREAGHALVDWVADHVERIRDLPVTPDVAPGDVRALLPSTAPSRPEPFPALLDDLDRVLVPASVQWQHPRWFSYFPTGASYPSILAELASAALGQQGMLWATSPATTELEAHVLDWLADEMGLPSTWRSDGPGGGVIQHSASDSTHVALVVARERAARAGVDSARTVAYSSAQAHSSIEKGATVAGYGHLRSLPVDERFALDVDALRAAVAADREAGLHPTIVVAAVGTTATTAVDPVRAVAEVARAEGLWCHVDAAYAGAAMLLPEVRHHQDGIELVDSYTWNPHKWLGVNFDCSVFHVADRQPLLAAMSILPPYLRDAASHDDAAIDYRDWHVPLGRRTRALKLWWVLRSYGTDGLRAILRDHLAWASWLTDHVEDDPRLVLVAPTWTGLVTLAHADGDDATRALAAALVAERDLGATPTVLEAPHLPDGGIAALRLSIGSMLTTRADVEDLWSRLARLA